MTFVPLTPEEQEQVKPPCTSLEHYPPNMIYISHPCKWVCPCCGQETLVNPIVITCKTQEFPTPSDRSYWSGVLANDNTASVICQLQT